MVKENEVVKENERCRIIWTISWTGSIQLAGLVLGRTGFMQKREKFKSVGKPQDPGFPPREGSKATWIEQVPGLQFLRNKQKKTGTGTHIYRNGQVTVFHFPWPCTHQRRLEIFITSAPIQKHIFRPSMHCCSLHLHLSMRTRKDIIITSTYCLIVF